MLENSNSQEDRNKIIVTQKSIAKERKRHKKRNSSKDNILQDRYEFYPSIILGKGVFGDIYSCSELQDSSKLYAMKFENNLISNKLKLEKEIYELMTGVEGFPNIYSSGSTKTKNYIIIERLGPSLLDLFEYCNRHFSLQTILLIGIQILTRIHDLHYKTGFIHGDIRPENFLIGLKRTNLIYMIDFGLSKPFRNFNYQTSKIEHIAYKDNVKYTQANCYTSVNQHMGIETSRRDDLESLGYMLIYFANNSLPWETERENEEENNMKILEKKMSIPVEVYCKELPIEFSMYLNYVQSLRFNEKPDYNYLKGIFTNLLFNFYIEKFFFDWNIGKPKEIPTNLRINKELDTKNLLREEENKSDDIQKKNSKKKDNNKEKEEQKLPSDEDYSEESPSSSSGYEDDKEKELKKDNMKKTSEDNKKSEDSNLIISSHNGKINIEEKESDSESNKTEQNSFFNDEDFITMFNEIADSKKKKSTVIHQNNNPNLQNSNTNKNSNGNLIIHSAERVNTNESLLGKSNSMNSFNSISSESNTVFNQNKRPFQIGKLKISPESEKKIKEVDEDQFPSKRD